MLLVCLGTPALIRYVQDAILNLCHPYIGSPEPQFFSVRLSRDK